MIAKCNCGLEEEFEPDEFGMNYFQAEGTCPDCGEDLVDENGKPLKTEISFEVEE